MIINKRLWDKYFRWYDRLFFRLMGASTTTKELPTPNADEIAEKRITQQSLDKEQNI